MARSLSSNIVVSIAGSLLPPVSTLVMAPILARSLDVQGRGEVAAAIAPYLLAIAIATIGLPDALTRAVARSPKSVSRLLPGTAAIVAAAGMLTTLAIVLLSPVLSGREPAVAGYIALASVAIVPALLIGIVRGIASGLQAWRMVAAERAISGGLKLVAIIVLWLTANLSVLSAAIVLAYGPLLAGLVYLRLPHALRRIETRSLDARATVRETVLFGLKVWIGAIAGILLMRVDQVLLSPLSGAVVLGLYVVAVNISEVPLIVHGAVREVMFASDSEKHDDRRLGVAARTSFLLAAVTALLLAGTISAWLPLLFGSAFIPAVPATVILLFGVVVGIPGSIAGVGLSARGRPELRSWSLVAGCIVNILLLIWLTPMWGATGAAAATLVGSLVASNANIFFLARKFGVPWSTFYGVRRSDLELLLLQVTTRLRAPDKGPGEGGIE